MPLAKAIATISTLFFSISTIIPLAALAQTSGSSTIGQTITTEEGALTMPCTLEHFDFPKIDINSLETTFTSHYINPKQPHKNLTDCDGSGVTVQDTRYSGGFVLQVTATDYLQNGVGPEAIPVENLAIVTEQLNTNYIEQDNPIPDAQDIAQDLPFDFTEVRKPGSPLALTPVNGNPNNNSDYLNFTKDNSNPGAALNLDLINASASADCGRIGNFTIYPSYRLSVPRTTPNGTYTNTITYTLADATEPPNGSCSS